MPIIPIPPTDDEPPAPEDDGPAPDDDRERSPSVAADTAG